MSHLPTFSDDIKKRYFVKHDEAGDEFIRLNGKNALLNGGLCHIYLISADKAGLWTNKLFKPMKKKVPSLNFEQAGGGEAVFSCDIKHLDLLCEAANAKKRPAYTESTLEAMRQRMNTNPELLKHRAV